MVAEPSIERTDVTRPAIPIMSSCPWDKDDMTMVAHGLCVKVYSRCVKQIQLSRAVYQVQNRTMGKELHLYLLEMGLI